MSRKPPTRKTKAAKAGSSPVPDWLNKARDSGRLKAPATGIAEMRAARSLGVEETAKVFQNCAGLLAKSSAERLPYDMIAMVRMMSDRLNWLAEAGKLGDAPRRSETWPLNYAPDASKGAGKWEAADELYRRLGCGKEAALPRRASRVNYADPWTAFANDALRCIWVAQLWIPHADELKDKAVENWRYTATHGKSNFTCDYYLAADGGAIEWPGWAEKSRDLPHRLNKDNWPDFLPVIRELVRFHLLSDEKAMREFQSIIQGQNASRKWDADAVNRGVMKRVKDALSSLAER